MSEIDVVATITPKPGKADRVEQLLLGMTEYVHKSEPDTYRYHLHREIDKPDPEFVMIETYKDQSSFKNHGASDAFKKLVKTMTEEDLLSKPLGVYVVRPVGGFAGRSKM